LEVKYAYQPMSATWENGILTIFNKNDFTNLSDYNFYWEVTADGEVDACGELLVKVAPHQKTVLPFEVQIPKSEFGCYLNLSMRDKTGREVAFEQINLADGDMSILLVDESDIPEIIEDGEYDENDGAKFLQCLKDVGYLCRGYAQTISFEMRPLVGMSSEQTIEYLANWFKALC